MTFSFATSTMSPETLMEYIDGLTACTEEDNQFLVRLRINGLKFACKCIAYAEHQYDAAGNPCIRVYGATGSVYRFYLFDRKACDKTIQRQQVTPAL